jgi:4-hydroxybenzoate polyprenyltransferase
LPPFILIAATLYIYATSLKQMLLLGNIVVALLLSFSVIIIGILIYIPSLIKPISRLWQIFSILLDFALFAL